MEEGVRAPMGSLTTPEASSDAPVPLGIYPVGGIGEVLPGADLTDLLAPLLRPIVQDGDVVVISSKVVSKAEGRVIPRDQREEAIDRETVRVVAAKAYPGGVTKIVENRQGLIQAAAGIDASNTPEGTCLLLPEDPDRSARELCGGLRRSLGKTLGVVMTDTMGRPWRLGQTDVAIGAAGIVVLDDLAGEVDSYGHELHVTAAAIADEIAGAANLVLGKSSRCPAAIVRGLSHYVGSVDLPGARSLQRPPADDLFRTGSQEAFTEGFTAGLDAAAQRHAARSRG